MNILLLGPVELRAHDGSSVHIGGARRRAVLATLAMDVNRVVPVGRLLDTVWDQAPPPTAKTVLQGHVAGLRGIFDDSIRLVTREPGYMLQADPEQIDVHRQQGLLARAQAQDDRAAVQLLRQALGQWRGPALSDCGSTALREGSAQRFESTRLQALEQLAERLLRIGQGPLAGAELAEALAAHPLRESLARLTMLCLQQEGRQAEALAAYHQVRLRLAEELGVDPGAELQAAFAQVLAPAPAPAAPAAQVVDEQSGPVGAPAQLPREAGGFIGREAELAWLGEHAGPDGDGVLLVTGPAGVGKTALVLRWAHRHATTFPDGRIGVNLRGFDETEPLRPEEALASLLRALGVAESAIPGGLEDAVAQYRTALAGRRVLIVLENARSAEQVLPLLPAEPGCVALVTSRHRLCELVAQEGAVVLPLDALSAEEAFDVLARVAGRQRLTAEPEAARQVVELCERLPLALRIAGSRLATRPHWSVAALAGELADERSRLAALSTQGPLSVEAALELTCRALPEPAAELFRLLGTHPGQQIDPCAAAALVGTDRRAVRGSLDVLDSAHLVQETAPGRYARHDLVRLYARHAAESLPAADRQQALTRLLDYYLAATAAAVATTRPEARYHHPPQPPTGGVPPFAKAADAAAWFRGEEPVIRDLAGLAHGRQLHAHGCRLAENAGFLYNDAGRFREWEQVIARALAAADSAGIAEQWPHLYSNHSLSLGWQGRTAEALRQSERAFQLADPASRPVLRHRYRSMMASFMDRREAMPLLETTVAEAREAGDGRLLSQALNNLADGWRELGRPQASLAPIEESLRLLDGQRADPFLVISTKTYAQVLHGLGRTGEAVEQIRRMLAIGREQGNVHVEFDVAHFMGQVLHDQGRTAEARQQWEQALEIATEQGRLTRQVKQLKARLAAG
ncbi:BTAD domain-containing putative transcriptional regulator [Kitasatospora kazusensis]|uniref:BTAD domain-containing putative transcriptional regulator n=1 Tax=Kitasatospora kazusensis TaxID=407974 RepID=A0ABP5L8M5_9ACTN